jgi:hypothetical protein
MQQDWGRQRRRHAAACSSDRPLEWTAVPRRTANPIAVRVDERSSNRASGQHGCVAASARGKQEGTARRGAAGAATGRRSSLPAATPRAAAPAPPLPASPSQHSPCRGGHPGRRRRRRRPPPRGQRRARTRRRAAAGRARAAALPRRCGLGGGNGGWQREARVRQLWFNSRDTTHYFKHPQGSWMSSKALEIKQGPLDPVYPHRLPPPPGPTHAAPRGRTGRR